MDPEVFFPPKGDAGVQAKQACTQCPVRAECLDYAITADEQHGIWGGLNRAERQRAGQALESRRPANTPKGGAALSDYRGLRRACRRQGGQAVATGWILSWLLLDPAQPGCPPVASTGSRHPLQREGPRSEAVSERWGFVVYGAVRASGPLASKGEVPRRAAAPGLQSFKLRVGAIALRYSHRREVWNAGDSECDG
jgi:Transcription factor WhiB